jgi:hypothetical protein
LYFSVVIIVTATELDVHAKAVRRIKIVETKPVGSLALKMEAVSFSEHHAASGPRAARL